MATRRLLYLLIVIEILMMTTCMPQSALASDPPTKRSVEQVWNTTTEGPCSVASNLTLGQDGDVYIAELIARHVLKLHSL